MRNKVRVTLIHKDSVAKGLERLDRAKMMQEGALKLNSIAAAKKRIRDIACMSNGGKPSTNEATKQELEIYRKHLQDVEENLFVIPDNCSIIKAESEIV